MKGLIKLFLLLIAIFPVWLTIIAFAATNAPSAAWRDAINQKLLEQSNDSKRIQVVELSETSDALNDQFLTEDFELKLLDPKSKGFSMIELIYRDEEGKLKRILKTAARLMIENKVVVTTRDLNRGYRLQASDLALEWRDLTGQASGAMNTADMIGRTLRTPIKAGRPIAFNQLEADHLVRMGERVRVIVSGNGLKISGFGIARQNGQKGETVRILNPDSKKEIYGVVTADQVVEVQL